MKMLHGDCLELMKEIPEKSIDMILCDLPYGVLNKNNKNAQWDNILPFDKLWKQYERIIKENGTIVLFGSGMFTAELMISNKKIWRYNLIWKKGQRISGFLNAKLQPLRNHEDIMIFFKKQGIYNPQMTIGNKNHIKGGENHKHTQSCYGNFKDLPTILTNEKYPISIINIDKDNYTEGQDLVVKFNGNVATKTISPLDGETEYYETLITLPGGTKYTVTFETYGGAPVPENQLVLEGKKATKPSTDPQKGSDLVFGGWYTDTTFKTPFNFNNPITENTTIYAKWNEKGAYTQGDLDRNGVVDANDASVALELYKAQNATAEDVAIGDMDNNDLIDANDASLILEYYKTHQ